MIIQLFLLILGFVILIKGADIFVDGSSSVAGNFKVSKMLIGLTIVSFGTSAPEFAVSIKSIISNNHDIVLGNVVGSNIFNIGLVIGLPIAIFGGINYINFNYVDLTVMLISSILLFLFAFKDHKISKKEGFIFLIIF